MSTSTCHLSSKFPVPIYQKLVMERSNLPTNSEPDKKPRQHSKMSVPPPKKKNKDHNFFKRIFGKNCQQTEAAPSSSGSNNEKRTTIKSFFGLKEKVNRSTSEFTLLQLEAISSSNESQTKPFLVSDQNTTQTSGHVLAMGSKARHKPFTVPRKDQQTTKLIMNDDLLLQMSRSIHADIGRENAVNNSIATQQNCLLLHQATGTVKRFYENRGMQSEGSTETILPRSSSDSNDLEAEDEASVTSLVSSSIALAPKNSKNHTKTPEAGDKATPQAEKTESKTPLLQTDMVSSQALVPFKEDTLWLLLHARSKLLSFLGDAVQEQGGVLNDQKAADADAKVNTYKNMQSDIKHMITDLLLQSSEIKGDALSAGVLEEDSPPLICDFLDSYYSTASASDDVSQILDAILQRVDEKTQKPIGIGDADDVKSALRPFILPLGQKNVTETYFCTTSFDRIPKTSWIFGDTRNESKSPQDKGKTDGIDEDILLEGCSDLLSGLFDPKEQFVCMVHDVNMKKSAKSVDVRSKLPHRTTKLGNSSATEEETIVRNTYLSYSSSSLPQSRTGDASKPVATKVSIQSASSSDDSLIKSKTRAKKPVPVRKTSDLSGYDSDQETEEDADRVKKPNTKKVKSIPEVNTPEEIKKIEENVAQNSKRRS